MQPTYRTAKHKSKTRGQSMVEFAMTLPILLLLVLGIMEFGRLLFVYSSVISAAREAARYGAAGGVSEAGVPYYQHCNGIRAAAMRIGGIAAIANTAGGINIQYDNGPDETDTITQGCPVNGTGPTLDTGDRIVVVVTAQFRPMQGIVPLPEMPITSTVRRTLLINISLD